MEDYIKCEPISGMSLKYLNSFSNSFIITVQYTHINTCYVLLLLLTTPKHNIPYLVAL